MRLRFLIVWEFYLDIMGIGGGVFFVRLRDAILCLGVGVGHDEVE